MRTLLPAFRTDRLFNLPELNLFDSVLDGLAVPRLYSREAEWMPNIDIAENEKEFLVRAEVPGIDRKDIDITLSEGLLTIKGEKKSESQEEGDNYHRRESCYGSFTRSFRLPTEIETDKIEANYKDGVLKISIPKTEAVPPKKIEVKN